MGYISVCSIREGNPRRIVAGEMRGLREAYRDWGFAFSPRIKGIDLRMVVLELVKNAQDAIRLAKRHSRATLEFRASVERIAFYVADEADGVDPQLAPYMFKQLLTSEAPPACLKTFKAMEYGLHGGIGVGLQLSRTAVRRAGGSLEYLTMHSHGSVFSCSSPARPFLRKG